MDLTIILALGIGLVMVIGIAYRKYITRNIRRKTYPADTVILHQLGAGPYCPSLSPFVVKLETFLRMNNIKYQNEYDRVMSSKGKTPWIQFNDDVIPDSHFVIEYLKKRFPVKINDKLTKEEKAIGASFTKLVEDHLYWGLLLWRAVFDKNKTVFRLVGLNSIIVWIFEQKARRASYSHGLGRHTQQETIQLILDDIKFISHALGDKKYFLGEFASEADCAIFGQLCQIVWQTPDSPMEKTIQEKYPNLIEYCERMKTKYWPDWEEVITHGSVNQNHTS